MTKLSKKSKTNKGSDEFCISVFDIHDKTIGNVNEKSRTSTSAYEIRCHLDDSKIIKTLLARCFEDNNTDFSFILYALSQMITNET